MAYNGDNQLISTTIDGTTTSYRYRPDGLRFSKTTGANTVIHLWDGQNIVAEISGTGQLRSRFYRGLGLIAQLVDSTMGYYSFDAHGDVVQRTNAGGVVLKNYVYDAFGVEANPEPLDQNPFRYCGEYFDKETETLYLRARYYTPKTGRFSAEDPIKDAGLTGIPIAAETL